MLTNMSSASLELIMLKFIVYSGRCTIRSDKSYEIWYMHLFRKVFDVKTEINNLPFFFACFIKCKQEGSSQFIY